MRSQVHPILRSDLNRLRHGTSARLGGETRRAEEDLLRERAFVGKLLGHALGQRTPTHIGMANKKHMHGEGHQAPFTAPRRQKARGLPTLEGNATHPHGRSFPFRTGLWPCPVPLAPPHTGELQREAPATPMPLSFPWHAGNGASRESR